jgi:hypothetical protein
LGKDGWDARGSPRRKKQILRFAKDYKSGRDGKLGREDKTERGDKSEGGLVRKG